MFRTNINRSFFLTLNCFCYGFLILSVIYEVYIMKIFSFEHYFFIALNVLNPILYYVINNFFNIFSIKNIVKKDSPGIDFSLVINKTPKGDGGIQGFLGRIFKCDRHGLIADVFYIFNSNSCMVPEENLRDVTLDAKHIHLIYPMRNCLL